MNLETKRMLLLSIEIRNLSIVGVYRILQEKLTWAMSTARYESRPVESQKLARKMPLDGVLWFQVPHIHDSITHFVFSRS
jgi:hypothetical protein